MEITFINVGYGDSILVCEGEYRLLIDGGPAGPGEMANGRMRAYDWLRARGIKRLDAVVISHIHDDHVCGLEDIMRELTIGELWLPYPPAVFYGGREVRVAEGRDNSLILFARAFNSIRGIVCRSEEKGIRVRELTCGKGECLAEGSGLAIQVLGPQAAYKAAFVDLLRRAYAARTDEEAVPLLMELDRLSNDASLLLRISDGIFSALFPGDSCPPSWRHLLAGGALKSDLWKLPHHGQRDSVTEEAIRGIAPRVVVTTSSSDRRYNSSNAVVYETVRQILGESVQFVFSDEYSYPPYFSGKEGASAVRVGHVGGEIMVSFE